MNEDDWLASEDPVAMLDWLLKASFRGLPRDVVECKVRLFAAACCHDCWPLLVEEGSRQAVQLVEEAGGSEQREEAFRLADAAQFAVWEVEGGEDDERTGRSARWAASLFVLVVCMGTPQAAIRFHAGHADILSRAVPPARQAEVVRCIFGDPFRASCRQVPPPAVLYFRQGLPVKLAEAAYAHRQGDGSLEPLRLQVLADALEEGGCPPGDLLSHLRSRGPHWRGCWGVDAVLGGL